MTTRVKTSRVPRGMYIGHEPNAENMYLTPTQPVIRLKIIKKTISIRDNNIPHPLIHIRQPSLTRAPIQKPTQAFPQSGLLEREL